MKKKLQGMEQESKIVTVCAADARTMSESEIISLKPIHVNSGSRCVHVFAIQLNLEITLQ